MDETPRDRLEVWFDELAAEMRSGFRAVDARLCKIESRLDQTATKAELNALAARIELGFAQCATKSKVADLRAEMLRMNAKMKAWMLATILSLIVISLAAIFGLHHWS